MGKAKFEAGDWVYCIGDSNSGGYHIGGVYRVKEYQLPNGVYDGRIFTEMDDKGNDTNGWNCKYFVKLNDVEGQLAKILYGK